MTVPYEGGAEVRKGGKDVRRSRRRARLQAVLIWQALEKDALIWQALEEDMEAKAGEKMDALQRELARVTEERGSWLADMRRSRESEQAAVLRCDKLGVDVAAAREDAAKLSRELEQLRKERGALEEQVAPPTDSRNAHLPFTPSVHTYRCGPCKPTYT